MRILSLVILLFLSSCGIDNDDSVSPLTINKTYTYFQFSRADGYVPIWLPCIEITFKNTSNQDCSDNNFITAIFVDKNKDKQICDDQSTLSTFDKPIVAGTTKELDFQCDHGWPGKQQETNIVVRIYNGKELLGEYKIDGNNVKL